ncbi:MAG: HAD-IA family hydrolase [Pikeienuella sp.]
MSGSAIFDLDGTLVDTADDLITAMNDIADSFGLGQLGYAEARSYAGRGGRALMQLAASKVGREFGDDQVLAAYKPFLEAYSARITNRSQYFPGAEDAVETFLSSGWKVGICTNKPEGLALQLMKSLGGIERYAAILGADTLPVRKPDPEHVWQTIDRIGGDRKAAVMIGDTINDREAAANAGIPCVLYSKGFSVEPVESYKPEGIFDNFEELPALAARLVGASL